MKFRIITISVLVVVLLIIGFTVIQKAKNSVKELPYFAQVPMFDFINQDSVSYTHNQLLGKYTVVDFMFTRCHGPCPIMTGFMEQLYTEFKDNDKVQFLSISVDPEYDSVSVLKQYAIDHNVTDNRWQFIRNSMEEVVKLCEDGFQLSADDLPGAHTTKFVLVDEKGYIRGYYSGTDEESINQLRQDIKAISSK